MWYLPFKITNLQHVRFSTTYSTHSRKNWWRDSKHFWLIKLLCAVIKHVFRLFRHVTQYVVLTVKQQQLKYSQTYAKRNGSTMYNDWNNNFSQFICARLWIKLYQWKLYAKLPISILNFEVHRSWCCGPAPPPFLEPDFNTKTHSTNHKKCCC